MTITTHINLFTKVLDNGCCLHEVDQKIIEAIARKQLKNPNIWSISNAKRRENVHAFFLYPAMMVPGIQQELISIITSNQKNVKDLYDPFMGAGTSLVAGILSGLNCSGQDINPLALLLTKVKTGDFHFESFKRRSIDVLAKAKRSKKRKYIIFNNQKKWFRDDVIIELGKLRDAIISDNYLPARRFFWVTLAETIRRTSNDRMSTYKLHSLPQQTIQERFISPISVFEELVEKNLADLDQFKSRLKSLNLLRNGRYCNTVNVKLLDSTVASMKKEPTKGFDLLVTSPPYGDNKTTIPYGQHSYLPLQWIDLKDIDDNIDFSIISSYLTIDKKSIGGMNKKLNPKTIEYLYKISPSLKKVINLLLEKGHKDKILKIQNFFYDLEKSFTNILSALKPNAYIIWTVGNRFVGGLQIPNDKIMTEFLLNKGAVYVTEIVREIHNKKMPLKNNFSKTMKEEKILILRKSEK